MVFVSEEILKGLEACRDSGDVNMIDWRNVFRWLSEHRYYSAAKYVHENTDEYAEGIFTGFDIA